MRARQGAKDVRTGSGVDEFIENRLNPGNRAVGGRLRFSGSARSGEGELNLEGFLAPFEQQAEVTIKGENFEALDSFSQMLISPDMQIVVESGQIRVSGTVEVPSAQLSPPATGPRLLNEEWTKRI